MVVGLEENHPALGRRSSRHVRNGDFAPGHRWSIVRPTVRFATHPQWRSDKRRQVSEPWNAQDGLRPETSSFNWAYYATSGENFEVLGWEVIELSQGVVTRDGDPSTLLLTPGGSEVKVGDLLMPYDEQPFDLSFYPHAMSSIPADLRSWQDRSAHVRRSRDVIAISGGAREGIENGHVFAIYSPGEMVRDDIRHKQALIANRHKNKVQLPDEFVGHVMIFRTFDKVSYGLIMNGIRPARIQDELRAPDRL